MSCSQNISARTGFERSLLVGLLVAVAAMVSESAVSQRYRNTANLRSKFYLCKELDVTAPGLEEAYALRVNNDSLACETSAIIYFLSRPEPCTLAPVSGRSNAAEKADDILENLYQFWVYDSYELPTDLTWTENPVKSRNWAFMLHTFEFLWILNAAYEATGDVRYLERGKELVSDFARDNCNPAALPSKEFSWYDHTASNRAIFLIDFWRHLVASGTNDNSFARIYLELIWRHGLFLAHSQNYNPKSNHGLFSAFALLRISLEFPEFINAEKWKLLAIQWIESQVKNNFSATGAHLEFSPWYQLWAAGLLEQFRRDCFFNGVALSRSFLTHQPSLIASITHFVFPDGTLSQVGDSDARPTEKLMDIARLTSPYLNYALTAGREGKRPVINSTGFSDAKMFVMRSGWGEERPLREESCLIANFSGPASAHNQQDFLSFEMYSRGQRWITDLGRWGYNYKDERRKFIVSPRAHNIMTFFRLVSPPAPPLPAGKKPPASLLPKQGTVEVAHRTMHILASVENIPFNDPKELEALWDTIAALRDVDMQIAACKKLLERKPAALEDRIHIALAFCYGETKRDLAKAKSHLEPIIRKGEGSEYYTMAVTFRDLLEAELHEQSPPPAQTPQQAQEREARQSAPSINEIEFELNKGEPTVQRWIKRKDYDYLEGRLSVAKGLVWSRAILFVKPHLFLLVDKVESDALIVSKQFFHLPPEVSVEEHGDGFRLFTGDKRHCILMPLIMADSSSTEIIKGRKTPEMQGWYSSTFWDFEPAPVIQFTMDLNPGVSYIVHLIVPTGKNKPGKYSIKVVNDAAWSMIRIEPLQISVRGPDGVTRISYAPSFGFMSTEGTIVSDPVIEISRRRR